MTTYFAQSSTNINGSNVWNTAANGSGSYLTWPPASDDVLMANNKTITVNVDTTVAEVRNDTTGGATAGGKFALSASVTLTANVYAGTTSASPTEFSIAAPANAYLVGNLTTVGIYYAAQNTSSGTLTITGNALASPGYVVVNVSSGTINLNGDANAGNGPSVANVSTGIVSISGHVTGGTAVNAYGAANQSTGTLSIGGSVKGGTGASSFGAINGSSGILNVGKAIGNGYGNGSVGIGSAPGVSNSQTGTCKVKSIQYGALGQTPTVGPIFIEPDNGNQAIFVKSDLTTLTLSRTDGTDFGNPSTSDVRYGTVYALGSLTGTCHVPTASQVSAGVPVDATTGTAVLTAANVRDAIGLASANLDTQLADLPTAAENATAVWGSTTRSLTEAPDVPTVEEIADQIRTELTPELERVANCATVESTGDQLAGLI